MTNRALLLIGGVWLSQCSKAAPPPAPPAALLGEMKAVVSVKELMQSMIDPMADNIFDAVTTDITARGIVETAPHTEEDWEKVQTGAVTIAEGIYLLKVPRPFAPAGDENDSKGPNAPELSPADIQAKVSANPALWTSHIEQLRSVALEVMDIVKRKDTAALFDAGGKLDKACESCHLEYWYPADRKLVLEEEKQRARFEKANGRNHEK